MLDIQNIPLDDQKTWNLIKSGRTGCVFQLESHLGKHWCKKIRPSNIEELSAVISLVRPGCLNSYSGDPPKNMAQRYADRKNGLEKIEYYHESLEPMLNTTLGVMCYQEQTMAIASKIAGFTPEEANTLRKCIAKNSIVYTDTGPIYIQDLINKQNLPKILTFDKNGQSIYRQIKKVWSSGIQKVYRVQTTNGYFVDVTKNHQIFTQRGWVETSNLLKGDFIVIPKKYNFNKGVKTSIDRAIWFAYFLAEGCYTNKSEPKITNSDPWIINKITQSIDNDFGNHCYYFYKHQNGCIDIYLTKDLRRWIINNIEPSKSRHKVIPSFLKNSRANICKAFVGSFFSAEGSVNKGSIDISSTSIDIICNIQTLLLREGIHSSIITHNSKYNGQPYISYRLVICENKYIHMFKNVYKEYICPTKLNKLINFRTVKHNNSKFLVPDIFVKSVAKINNYSCILGRSVEERVGGSRYNKPLTYETVSILNQYIGSKLLSNILSNDFYFVKVKEIKQVDDIETYDFEICGNIHNGVINGILVHNSIGKKNAQLMSELKSKFIDGCKKVGIVNDKEAEEIFSWIEASNRYAFNRCLEPNTLVETKYGHITLRYVKIGEKILCPNNEWHTIINKYYTPSIKFVTITLEDGKKIECSIEHKFLCEDGITRPLYKILNLESIYRIQTIHGNKSIIDIDYSNKKQNLAIDIEIDSPSHIFYANGIATSNSHGIEYAINSYRTAYCKANYPLEFYCSYLLGCKWKQDSSESVKELVIDAREFGVEFGLPTLLDKKRVPYIKNNKIYFGLSLIRDIGDVAQERLLNAIEDAEKQHGPITTWSFLDTLIYLCDNVTNKVFEALIYSGSLDYFGFTRNRMFFEYEKLRELTKKELENLSIKHKEERYSTLGDALISLYKTKKEGGICHSKKRSEFVFQLAESILNPNLNLNDSIRFLSALEKKYLGISISCMEYDGSVQADISNLTCKDIANGHGNINIYLCAEVISIKEIKIKKEGNNFGKRMGILSIFDMTGSLDSIFVFPELYEEVLDNIEEGDSVFIMLDRSKKGGYICTSVEKI